MGLILCKLGLHKWHYTDATREMRYCERCGKKQMRLGWSPWTDLA